MPSDLLWFSGADASWAAKRFRGRFHQVSAKLAARFHQEGPGKVATKLRGVCGFLHQARFRRRFNQVPRRQGSTTACFFWGRSGQQVLRKVPPRFWQGCSGFHEGLSRLPRKVAQKVRPRPRQGSTHQTFAKLFQVSWRVWFWGQLRLGPPRKVHTWCLSFFGALGCQKVPRKVPPRFRQGCSKVGPCTKVPPRFHQSPTKVPPRFSKQKVRPRFDHSTRVPSRFHQSPGQVPLQFLEVSWCFWFFEPLRLGLPKGSAEGSTNVPTMPRQVHQCPTKVSPRCHQGSPSFVIRAGCQKGLRVPPRVHHGSTKVSLTLFHEGSTFVSQMAVVSERVLVGALCRFSNCSLQLCPSLVLGSKLHESLTCLTHTLPIRRGRPILSVLLGYSLGLFLLQLPPPACPALLVCLFGVCGVYMM